MVKLTRVGIACNIITIELSSSKDSKEIKNRTSYIIRGRVEIHQDQALVERFNRTLAEFLFGHQCAVEMLLPPEQRLTVWIKTLPDVVRALSNKVTHLTGKKPAVVIKEKGVAAKPSTPHSRPIDVNEKLPCNVNVRYLYQRGELEGGTEKTTDPI